MRGQVSFAERDYDVELWEHLCHLLARKAGIEVADTKVLKAIGPYHTLISRRFDRTATEGAFILLPP